MSYYYPYNYLSLKKNDYETLPINTARCVCSGADEMRETFEIHNHQPLELNAVIRGNLDVTLGGTVYHLSPGEAVIANPYSLHSGRWPDGCGDGEYLTLIVHIEKLTDYKDSPMTELFNGLLDGRLGFEEFYPAGSQVFSLAEELDRLYHDKSPANDALCLGQLFTLLGVLLGRHIQDTSNRKALHRDVEFLRNICAFVSKNYAESISTKDAAAAMYMEMSQFCRTFKRHFGTDFSNHLCKYRVMRAAELFSGSDEKIAVIAKSVGFKNYCYFSRSFKRYIGVTPAYYFGKWKNEV